MFQCWKLNTRVQLGFIQRFDESARDAVSWQMQRRVSFLTWRSSFQATVLVSRKAGERKGERKGKRKGKGKEGKGVKGGRKVRFSLWYF